MKRYQKSHRVQPLKNHLFNRYSFAKEDTYARIDYILLSHGMAREWDPAGTYIPTLPKWGIASDHRPLVATFSPEDR